MCDPWSKGCGRREFPLSHYILLTARDLSPTEQKLGANACTPVC